jgi:uncharacterized protein YkwD
MPMYRSRRHQTAIHRLLTVVLVAVLLLGQPVWGLDVAHAEPAAARDKKPQSERPSSGQEGDYLGQLLGEINTRRAARGSQPLMFAPGAANRAVDHYLADLTPVMMAYGSCFHGMYNPVPPGWDYVTAAGLQGEALGEVIACPDDSGYWTARNIADTWWASPAHHQAIYGNPFANVVACGTFGPQRGGQAFVTIACVTFRV